jgi:hypothetical protein
MTTPNSEGIVQVIETKFSTDVVSGLSLPTVFENSGTEAPDSGLWCMHHIIMPAREDESIGRPRIEGFQNAMIFGEAGEGMGALRAMADDVVGVFDRLELAGPPRIYFRECRSVTTGTQRGVPYAAVSCPFYHDEV